MVQQNIVSSNGRRRKLTPEEFVLRALEVGPEGKAKGLHTEQGFRIAFGRYCGKRDFDRTLGRMSKDGKVVVVQQKHGAMVYLPTNAPAPTKEQKADALLAKLR